MTPLILMVVSFWLGFIVTILRSDIARWFRQIVGFIMRYPKISCGNCEQQSFFKISDSACSFRCEYCGHSFEAKLIWKRELTENYECINVLYMIRDNETIRVGEELAFPKSNI